MQALLWSYSKTPPLQRLSPWCPSFQGHVPLDVVHMSLVSGTKYSSRCLCLPTPRLFCFFLAKYFCLFAGWRDHVLQRRSLLVSESKEGHGHPVLLHDEQVLSSGQSGRRGRARVGKDFPDLQKRLVGRNTFSPVSKCSSRRMWHLEW